MHDANMLSTGTGFSSPVGCLRFFPNLPDPHRPVSLEFHRCGKNQSGVSTRPWEEKFDDTYSLFDVTIPALDGRTEIAKQYVHSRAC